MYAAILLAAGQSSRMGQPKGLLDWQGKPLILHQMEQIKHSEIDRLIMVLGFQPDLYTSVFHAEDENTIILWNENWEQGKCSSILTGLAAIEECCKAILFVNVDQPLTATVIDALIGSHRKTGAGIHIPVYGRRRGHPVLISTRLMEALQTIREESQGLKGLIRSFPSDVVHVQTNDSSILFNFNTPFDYQGRVQRESF